MKIEKLVNGGWGLARDNSHTIFIPYVIPGEVVRASLVPGSKNPKFAEAVEIVEPSHDRVEAPCPYFTKCGGCDFQHMSYKAQLRFKQEILTETFARIAS